MLAAVVLFSVLWRTNGQIISVHPRNDTFCTGSTVLLSCTIYDNTNNNAADNTNWFREDNPPVGIPSTMINNTRNDDVVTSVLTIDNVTLNDNGTEYFCSPSFGNRSYVGAILIAGPPGGITDINITPDTITACGFVVQWSESSSDPVCGTVWYTVTISTEGGILIITDNTTMTNYSVTGLNSSTLYSVNVTASNNAGSSVPTGTSFINESPVNISMISLNSTSFTINWTISDPSYNYTVIWTNINTGVVDSFTVPENTNNYTVAGLGGNTTYNVSISTVDVCGMMMTSNTITVNITEEIPTDEPSLATNTSATDEDDNSNTVTVVVIVVPVTITTLVIAVVILVAVALYFLWNRKKNKNSDSVNIHEIQVKDNSYAQPFANGSGSQERSNGEYPYSYVTSEPRVIAFHSTNSVMPQQQ